MQTKEEARLGALHQLGLLDTSPSEAFDRITRMAGQLFDLPIAAVSLTDFDRQWFKSRVGVDHWSIPRNKAPCAQVAESSGAVVVPDLLDDPCYRDSPLAHKGVRFYAGAPLTTSDGFCLGAMCVLGLEPRQASESEMASLSDLAAMVMAQIELQHAFGRIDPLSGMANRIQFVEDLEDLARDCPGARRFAVLLDLASPEQLNNAVRVMGPAYLDDMVAESARAIRSAMGSGRTAYYVAATQFVLLAPSDAEEQPYIATLTEWLKKVRSSSDSRFVTTTAIGVVPFALGQVQPRDLLRMAHSTAQNAREAESKVSVYSADQDVAHRRRFTLLNAFGAALEESGQLRLLYQPRIDLASGACVGAEALLRWTHPSLGPISPGEFIPLVEQTSMIKGTTAWVLEHALEQLAAWRDAGLDLKLSLNVSAANLLEQDFVGRVVAGVAEHSLEAGSVELEITESAVMKDAGQGLAVLEGIASAGLRLAIDDFGTGYSSLSYLQRLPAQIVKIDQSFMRDLAADERKHTLVETMISLSHDLGYRVVAEGVETRTVLDVLERAHCDEAQGYLFGHLMEPSDFTTWLREWRYPRSSQLMARPNSSKPGAVDWPRPG